MPTYAWFATFRKDFDSLSPAQQAEFLIAISHFVDDIESGSGFRKGLRVKGIQGANGIFEMTWANNGRARHRDRPDNLESNRSCGSIRTSRSPASRAQECASRDAVHRR